MQNITLEQRREFLQFLGRSSVAIAASATVTQLLGCVSSKTQSQGITALPPMRTDNVELAPGLQYQILAQHQDVIGSSGQTFGYNNDFIAFLPGSSPDRALLWVNHESVEPYLVSGYEAGGTRTREQVNLERKQVGGSVVEIARQPNQQWRLIGKSEKGFRVDGFSRIPLAWSEPIQGSSVAIGSFGNCAGGVTPWGTILTCEENYQDYVGDRLPDGKGGRQLNRSGFYAWAQFFDVPPEHYGWVVEVNPVTKKSKKLVALGRFAHENACVLKAKDGRLVVYMGDDEQNQCLYKFISASTDSLERGELFVADTAKGRWISLDRDKNPILKKHFKNQTEIQVYTREAAHLVGGTPLNRPEDIERDPHTGSILVSLTNNVSKKDYVGGIFRLTEANTDPLSMSFKSAVYLAGGQKNGFACPDNLVFDPRGNLWFTTDISERYIETGDYKGLGHNALFFVPMEGPDAGTPLRMATAPMDAEFTGPCFSPDGSTLFLSVQHPGGRSSTKNGFTSHWPAGGASKPRPAVVAITGEFLQKHSVAATPLQSDNPPQG